MYLNNNKNFLFTMAVMSMFTFSAVATRDITKAPRPVLNNRMWLEANNGGLVECWNALMELKSCTNEIVLFFLNGQTNIGPECCGAIDTITRHCWPSMLTSLGFTVEEGNILRGYCDASSSDGGASPSPSPV